MDTDTLQTLFRALGSAGFEHTDAERVLGITDERNLQSIRLLARLGIRKTETRSAIFRGEVCVEHIYAVSRQHDG